MKHAWQERLERAGARLAGEEIADFGHAVDELRAVRAGAVVVPLIHLGIIRVGGEDATEFLHRVLTNDVKKLSADRAQYNGICSAKGRMLASFLLWREGSSLYLQVSRDLLASVLKKLSMYVLRSKVQLVDASDELILLGLAGRDVETSLRAADAVLPPEPMMVAPFSGGTVIRLGPQRFCLAMEASAAEVAWAALQQHSRTAGTPVWRWMEIADGIPQITQSVCEVFVPQMVNFDLIGGVSFQKGCYPGQEVVARTQYLGKVKRRMYLAHLEADDAPMPGARLFSSDLPEQPCGTILSAAPAPDGGFDVLVVVQMGSAEAGNVHLDHIEGPRLQFGLLPYTMG